jgi:hypothetical protein
MPEHHDVAGYNDRTEAVGGTAADRDSVAGGEGDSSSSLDVDRGCAVLDEEGIFVRAEIRDRGLKRDRKAASGFLMAEGGDSLDGIQRLRDGSPKA